MIGRALMAGVAVCFGELLLMLACFPMGMLGILPSDAEGIEVPPLLLIVGAAVIWLGTFAWLTLIDWEP